MGHDQMSTHHAIMEAAVAKSCVHPNVVSVHCIDDLIDDLITFYRAVIKAAVAKAVPSPHNHERGSHTNTS